MQEERAIIRCPKCATTQVYFRVKSQDYQCQKCGNRWERHDAVT